MDELKLDIKRTNPKEDAKTHKIESLDDILKAVNETNVDGFLEDFGIFLKTYVFLKSITKGTLDLKSYDWIDDKQ